ncbi:hypothetical protein [Tardiphaga sp. 862_B3_N1_1]|uniref:hypothetical protein n=1 Tax=Tardiphaga sp. 862_B3_N1_1 TaxID=3240763 RepID=UPI003F89A620
MRLILEPPAGAVLWRILRKASDSFAGHDDASAAVIYEGNETTLVDAHYLQNDAMAFYRPFYSADDGATWSAAATVNATPRATYHDYSTDVMDFLRDRLEAGLKVEVERGVIAADHGYVQVFSAPPLQETAHFPVVTLHLESEKPAERAIGEYIGGDEFDISAGDWEDSDGWLADVRLQVIGWSLNADERKELRKAIRRVIVGNLSVLNAHGIEQIELEQSDVDAMNGEYGVPQMFQTVGVFTCLAAVNVGGKVNAIKDVEVNARSIDG